MKIVLIIPTLTSGGAERVISLLANEWARKGYKIYLLVWNAKEPFYDISSDVIVKDLDFRYTGKINRFMKQIKVLFGIRSQIKQVQPDFVLSFLTINNVLVLLANLFLKTKIYVSERNSPEIILQQLSKPYRFFRYLLYSQASGIIVQTQMAKDFILKEFPFSNAIAIANPIHSAKYKNIERQKIILNVGRLIPQKGQKDLVQVFAEMNLKDWKLVILGEGILRNELENLTHSLGIVDKVELPGSVKNISNYLNKATVFAFPSYFEGFPNALAEAMISGLPVVSYDCNTGPSELINNGVNGYLVPVGNIDEFKEKLLRLVQDEQTRNKFSLEAVKIANKLSIEEISKRYFYFCIQTHKEK